MADKKNPVYVFNYDRTTGVYTNYTEAHESPREPGVYHVPAFATLKEPPITGVNQYAWFNQIDNVWILREHLVQAVPATRSWLERIKEALAGRK